MNSALIEILAPRYAVAWYPWAVQYFFMVALAYAALWLTAPGLLFARQAWRPVAQTCLLIAALCALVAPIALVADLHRPLRFWHFYAYFTPWSWMSLGAVFLPLFVCAVLALAWLVWRDPMLNHRKRQDWYGRLARLYTLSPHPSSPALIRLFAATALFFSLGIVLYTGMEVAILTGRPLWNTLWLPAFFVGTGFVGATGLALVIHRLCAPHDSASLQKLLLCLTGATLFSALVVGGWALEGTFFAHSTVAKALAFVRHVSEWREIAFWTVAAGFGSIVFSALMARGVLSLRWEWALGGVAVFCAWMCRWIVLMDVQTVQKHTAGFTPYAAGWGSSGWLGVIGIFGLWIALLMVVDMLIDWRFTKMGEGPLGQSS